MGPSLNSLKMCVQGAPRTHCHPPHSRTILALRAVQQNTSTVSYSLQVATNVVGLMALSIAAVSYIAVSDVVDQFQLHFLHRFSYFSMKAEPQILTGVFLTAGLNSVAVWISNRNP